MNAYSLQARRWALAALLCPLLALPAGCSWLTSGRGSTSGGGAPRASENPDDLSMEESAIVCLRASREFEATGQLEQAAASLERARIFNPSPRRVPDIQKVEHRLAVLYSKLGKPSQAQREFDRARHKAPEDPSLLNDYGYFCYQRGDWPQAERAFRKAIALDEANDQANVNLGMALAQQGKDRAAYFYFEKALPKAKAYANLGMIQAQRGDLDAARLSFEQALSHEPNLFSARDALALIKKKKKAATIASASPFRGGPEPKLLPPTPREKPSEKAPEPEAASEASPPEIMRAPETLRPDSPEETAPGPAE